MCKKALKKQISAATGLTSKVFAMYDKCVVVDECKLKGIKERLSLKKETFKRELKIEKSGMGTFKINGKYILCFLWGINIVLS